VIWPFRELLEKKKHFRFSDALRICVIELSKVQDSMPRNDTDAWALFLKNPNNSYKEKIMETFPEIKDIYSKLELFSSDRVKRDEYEAREKVMRDSFAFKIEFIEEGREKGRKEGREEGRKEGREEGEAKGKAAIIQTLLLTQTREQVCKMLNISVQQLDQLMDFVTK
jgi:predicted transposase/invertase (TIGR01784 family)